MLRSLWSEHGPNARLALAQDVEEALGPLDGFGHVPALDERPATDDFLGLGEWPVDDAELAILQTDLDAHGRRRDPTRCNNDARLGRLLDELAHLLVDLG